MNPPPSRGLSSSMSTAVASPITVTEQARKVLAQHLADSPKNQFIRVHVGRS